MNNTIEIKNLHKSYGLTKVLHGIDLHISTGQVIGYIGPNGAGKSTTVRILAGLDGSFSGDVYVNGISIKEDPIAVKKIIGYIPEVAELYEVLTPMEFLTLMGKLHGLSESVTQQRAIDMLGHFGLTDHLNNRMDTFSKGMRQKVLITSGLLHNPQIIFMDEPLTGLDANAVMMVKEIISKLASEGKTIFYCSHMMDVVEKVSDRIILINQGQIIADGSFAELKRQHNDSLENVFANLTGQEGHSGRADSYLKSLNQDG